MSGIFTGRAGGRAAGSAVCHHGPLSAPEVKAWTCRKPASLLAESRFGCPCSYNHQSLPRPRRQRITPMRSGVRIPQCPLQLWKLGLALAAQAAAPKAWRMEAFEAELSEGNVMADKSKDTGHHQKSLTNNTEKFQEGRQNAGQQPSTPAKPPVSDPRITEKPQPVRYQRDKES